MNLILSCLFDIEGREPYLYDFFFTKKMLACIEAFTDQFVSELV